MKDKIIARGREQLLKDPEVQAKIAEIRREVEAKYAEKRSIAGWFQRRLIQAKAKKEIARKISEFAPRDGLYFHQS